MGFTGSVRLEAGGLPATRTRSDNSKKRRRRHQKGTGPVKIVKVEAIPVTLALGPLIAEAWRTESRP